jgi:hypothetical protein
MIMSDAEIFIQYINNNYKEVGGTLRILCAQRNQKFDEDAFHETILRCHKAIEKKGFLKDKSAYGIQSYLIRSYFNIVLEEKRSAKNAKRDRNYNSDNIGGLYEDYYNSNNVDARQKVISDMFKDFAVLYIMMVVEQQFDNEHFYLFKLKELVPNMTYKKLAEKTGIKAVRSKVVEVKKWVQCNVSKDDIRKEFYLIYGDII